MSNDFERRRFLGLAAGAAFAGLAVKLRSQRQPPMPSRASSLVTLKCRGRNFVDARTGAVVFGPGTAARGFDIQPIKGGWSSADIRAIKHKGATMCRVIVFWDELEPVKGRIDTTEYIPNQLDPMIDALSGNGIYAVLSFYYGPNGKHAPSWLPTLSAGKSAMGNYVNHGQMATQYLAKRYGNSSSAHYTPAVIGMGLNEITPDDVHLDSWLTTLYRQQNSSMVRWMRAGGHAPQWIADICSGSGASAPYPNAPGSGHSSSSNHQTFTRPGKRPITGGNFFLSIHDYLRCLSSKDRAFDGRTALGLLGSTVVKVDDTSYPAYPPAGFTRAICTSEFKAYLAPYVAYCAPDYANVPLCVMESGFVPRDGGTTFTGATEMAHDKITVWTEANVAAVLEWDFSTNQSNDPFAAYPGSSAPGTNSDGWQKWTDTVMPATL